MLTLAEFWKMTMPPWRVAKMCRDQAIELERGIPMFGIKPRKSDIKLARKLRRRAVEIERRDA